MSMGASIRWAGSLASPVNAPKLGHSGCRTVSPRASGSCWSLIRDTMAGAGDGAMMAKVESGTRKIALPRFDTRRSNMSSSNAHPESA